MAFMSPRTDVGVGSNTPGRQSTQLPTQALPLVLGRGRVVLQLQTPILHWHFRTFKLGQDAWFSAYGWLCCGPVDEIVQILINDKPYNGIFKMRSDYPGTEYIDHVMPFGDVTSRFRIWWGLEDHANYGAYLQSLVGPDCPEMFGKTHPDYHGICAMALQDVYAGPTSNGETPPVPKIEVELHRRSPTAYSFGYAPHGTHPIGIIADLFTLKRGGRGLPLETTFNVEKLTAAMQRLMDVGVATMKGMDLFVSFVFAEVKELDEHVAEVLEHFGGWLVERDGLLEVDWSPCDSAAIDEESLREITEHELAGDDVDEDPGDLDGVPSQVVVTGLEWNSPNPLTEASESAPVPFVQRVTGEPRAPEPINRRGYTTRWQLKAYATLYAALRGSPEATYTVPVLRQYAVQLDDVTPLRVGDLFVLNLAGNGGKRVLVRITERTAEDSVKVVFTCVRERGTFPAPAETVLDPRLDPTIPPPADLERFTMAQLPPELDRDAGTFVTALVERPANSTVMWELDVAPVDAWPGMVLESGSPRWAVAAVLQTNLAADYAEATVTVNDVGIDWAYLRSQSGYEQDDDRLLLYHAGEWCSVGTITPGGDGSYTLDLQRGRLGSLPAAHAIDDVVFIVARENVVFLTHADFDNVESAGAYDVTTATKWFKLRPLGAGGLTGNFTAAVSLTLLDPTPDAITGLTAITGTGKIVDLRWDPVTTSLVNEYSVHRATGPGFSDWAQIGEAAQSDHPRYIDIAVTIGTTYRYKVKSHATGEAESPFSGTVNATPGAVDTYSPDLSAPAAALAPVQVGGGTYLADDGTVLAYATVLLKALPAGSAVGQYLLHGIDTGDPADLTNAKPYYNTSDEVVRIDDLSPKLVYRLGAQTFNINGIAANVTDGGTFTAGYGPTPVAPSGLAMSIDADDLADVSPLFYTSGATAGEKMQVGVLTWNGSSSRDVAFYELLLTGPTSLGYQEEPTNTEPVGFTRLRTVGLECRFVAGRRLVQGEPDWWVRAVTRSRVPSVWVGGVANSMTLDYGTAGMAEQEPDAVAITGGSISGMTTIGIGSSRRWKTNIRPIARPLALLWRLRGVVFDRTNATLRDDIGLIAEEVDAVPELRALVTRDDEGLPNGLDYGKMVALCVAALKELAVLGASVALILLLLILFLTTMASGYTCKVAGVDTDLDDIFEPRGSSTAGAPTGFTVAGVDLNQRYYASEGPDQIGFDTGYLVDGGDLRHHFRRKGYVPPVYADVTDMEVTGVQAPGNLITITATIVGDGPLTISWRKEGVLISGATSDSYSFVAAGDSDDGTYECQVTGPYNSATNWVEIDIDEEDPEVTVSISGSSVAPIGSYGPAHSWTLTADATDGLARVRFQVDGHGSGAWLDLTGAPTHYSLTTDWADPFGSPSISHTEGFYTFYVDAEDIHGNTAHDSMIVHVDVDDP